MKKLCGLGAVITGATRGIGRETALELASYGMNLAVCSRDAEATEALKTEIAGIYPQISVYAAACDISIYEQVEQFINGTIKALPSVDVLINNAGIGFFESFSELSLESWEKIFKINLGGEINICKSVLPYFLKNEGSPRGYIINIGSSSPEKYVPGNIAYASSKASIETFSSYLFNEYRKSDINVTYASIGSVDTSFSKRNASNAEWKIKPREIAAVIGALIKLAYSTENACVDRIDIKTKHPKECLSDKE